MAIANLVVRIAADIADFEKNIQGVERTLARTGRELESLGTKLTKGLTLPLVAGLGVVSKAAIDFESSFAGIRKTVNATETEFASLSQGMRDLAKTIPVNVNELNKIGEAAGQLGIKTGNILEFTEVMAKLGVTTNLSSDQAATSLARFANIVDQVKVAAGTFEFDRLGSTIVALGNNFATTEAEIVDFGLRIAGAGRIAGLSESQILAIGAAMSSVGVQAEAGGTAVQKVLNSMTEAVSTGGKALAQFAATSGQSAKQFADAFRADAGQAFARFVSGLQAEGDRAFVTLDNLKLGNERVVRAFLSLANAGDLLTNSLRVGGEAWSENAALTREAEERFKTTASQLAILRNHLNDAAITLGQAFLPILNDVVASSKPLVQSLADMATAFKELPKGVQATGLAFAGVLAALGPILFVVGAITNALSGVVKAFRFLIPEVDTVAVRAGDATKVFSGFLGTIGRFAGPLAIAASGLFAIKEAFDAFNRSTSEGIRTIAGAIPGIGLMDKAISALSDKFPRLQAVIEDIVSIIRSSMILAWRELVEAFETVQEAIGTTIRVLGQTFQPVLDAFNVKWEQVVRTFTGVVIPAIKAVTSAFLLSIPPIRDFLFVLSKVPGFGEIEKSLDDVAKGLERTVAEANGAKVAVSGLGVAFKSANTALDPWGTALESAGKNLTSASSASLAFGPRVDTGVTKPLRLATTEMDKASVKAKLLRDALESLKGEIDTIDKSMEIFAEGFDKDLTGALESLKDDIKFVEEQISSSFEQMSEDAQEAGKFIRDEIDRIAKQIEDFEPPPPKRTWFDNLFGTAENQSAIQRSAENFAKGAMGALADAFRTGDWSTFKDQISDTISTFMAEAIATAIDFGVPGLGQLLKPLIKTFTDKFVGLFRDVEHERANDVRDAFLSQFGPGGTGIGSGFSELARQLNEVGAAGDALFQRLLRADDVEELNGVIADITKALDEFGTEAERAQKRLEALGRAAEGVNQKAALFAAPFLKLRDAIKDADGAELEGLQQKMQAAAQAGQAEFERLGVFVAATFAGIVRETGNAFDAITQLAPAFQILKQGLTEFGLEGTATIDKLVGLFDFINDEVFGPILQNIQATGQIFAGLQEAGILTADLFQTVASDIGASFRDLEAKGGDVATALALSQPILQRLWEAQQIYGEITDETTRKLLKQAEEQGLVGAHMRDVNQKILDVLIAIADVFGAKIPDAIRLTSSAGQEAAQKLRRDFKETADGIKAEFANIEPPDINIKIRYDDPGFAPNVSSDEVFVGGRVPALASGGIVRHPTLALVGESGPEAVVPLSHLSGGFPSVDSADATTVIIELDGRAIAEATVPHIPGVARRYVGA